MLVDSQLKTLPDNTLIGNGSRVVVKATPFSWAYKGKSGFSLGLDSVQILDLVEFKKNKLEGLTKRDGYITSDTNVTEQLSDSPFKD